MTAVRVVPIGLLLLAWSSLAQAQTPTPATETGAPPSDAAALVSQQKEDAAPDLKKPLDGKSATVSAGGQMATGNARLFAATANGQFDMRKGMNGFGAGLLGNYAQGAAPKDPVRKTTQNIQGRLRYDLYFLDDASGFLIATGRNDYFQGIDFRLNLDPGVKYLVLNSLTSKLWGELGYDFEHQINNNDARVLLDGDGKPVPFVNLPHSLVTSKAFSDHSLRLFAGYKHAFNKEVTFSTGLEYLQSFVESTRYRLNFDALLAASLGAGFSIGVGFTARYDHDPLPGKKDLDTTTTLSLIYGFSDVPKPPPAAPAVCAPTDAPPPPPVAPPPPPPPQPANTEALPPPPPPPPPPAPPPDATPTPAPAPPPAN